MTLTSPLSLSLLFQFARLDVDFVTSRGNLARILNVLNGKDGKGRKWTLLATRYRGTVYLSHVEDVRDDQQSTFARRVCYWGKRFEVEVTENWAQATSFPGSSSWPLPANEVEQHGPIKAYPGFFSVLRFQLENHRIALRAEVDAEMQVRRFVMTKGFKREFITKLDMKRGEFSIHV